MPRPACSSTQSHHRNLKLLRKKNDTACVQTEIFLAKLRRCGDWARGLLFAYEEILFSPNSHDQLKLQNLIYQQLRSALSFYYSMETFSRRQIDDTFLIFPGKQDLAFHANCLLLETICMKCRNMFSGKNKKNISKCRLLHFFPAC